MDRKTRLKLFDALRAEQGSFLEAILWRLTGDRELFAEALQESLMQIWRYIEQLQGSANRAYIYRIAQSAVSRAWRQRMGSANKSYQDREGPADRPEDRVSRKEQIDAVRWAISELPEQQCQAITMRYLEQKDYDVMARELDCTEATSRVHVSRALLKLRERLGHRREEA